MVCYLKQEASFASISFEVSQMTTELITFNYLSYHLTWRSMYSKAFRCMFFWEWKNSCSSKFVQIELLNNAKARSSKIRAA